MAQSSSAKKAAQVAARSSAKSSKKANWLFPAAIAAIVALGIGVVAFARAENEGVGDNDTPPRAQLAEGAPYDHWHAGYSINVCGNEIGPVVDDGPDVLGIHTHAGESLIHIHPFRLQSAGENARMQHFFDQVGMEVTDTGFKMPDGQVFSEEETTCGGEPTELTMAFWADPLASTDSDSAPDDIFTEGFGDIRFEADRQAYALALLPVGEVPAMPTGVQDLLAPSDVDPSATGLPEGFSGELPEDLTGDEVVGGGTVSVPEGANDPAAEGTEPAAEGTEAEGAEEPAAGSGG